MKLVVLDSVVQRVLHKSRSVWVLNNTRHSVYIPKDSQPRQVQAYYQKQDTEGAVTCLWGGRGKWHNPLWRTEVEISPSPSQACHGPSLLLCTRNHSQSPLLMINLFGLSKCIESISVLLVIYLIVLTKLGWIRRFHYRLCDSTRSRF